ncbi:MAG TPA: SDR family oxidoreductase, partial [Roseiflexaceae bacterium]|nr:SDR family oxidoreductase [Roseiflexaceae bacterium]
QRVANLADVIAERHGGVDIVISNAAARISPQLAPAEQVANFVDTNNHGTSRMIRAFLPILNDGARFVVVASSFGSLRNLPPELHHHFDVERASLEEIETTMDAYVQLAQADRAGEAGWPDWINVPSKIGQVAALKVLARMLRPVAQERDILVNAACPGLVDTDASRPWFADMSAAQSPDEAAVDVVWLATLPPGTREPYGELIQHRRIIPWM